MQEVSKLLVGFLNYILPSAGWGSTVASVGWLHGTAFPLKPKGAMTIATQRAECQCELKILGHPIVRF